MHKSRIVAARLHWLIRAQVGDILENQADPAAAIAVLRAEAVRALSETASQ